MIVNGNFSAENLPAKVLHMLPKVLEIFEEPHQNTNKTFGMRNSIAIGMFTKKNWNDNGWNFMKTLSLKLQEAF